MKYLTASLEDYLEIIYILSQRLCAVGITDIAKALCISKPSVTRAIRTLKTNNLVIQEKYGKIKLTEKGQNLAETVYSKHKMLSRFISEVLGVEDNIAEIDACKIEHILSGETLSGIERFLKKHDE